MKGKTLPRITPEMAKSVWQAHRRPSARRVATALSQAGYPVHFTTVAKWRSQDWRGCLQSEHPLEAAWGVLDSAVPVLTGDPTSTADKLVAGSEDKDRMEEKGDYELLTEAAREALKAQIIVQREIQAHLPELIRAKPAEMGVLIKALAGLGEAATDALLQALALKRPTG